MRVAVVGAGVSGLTAIKCCRDEGLDVVCFESRNDLGGLWNYTETVQPGQSNVTRFVIVTNYLLMSLQEADARLEKTRFFKTQFYSPELT